MTDRELLEQAAKAAEMVVAGLADKMLVYPEHRAGGLIVVTPTGGHAAWNPLTDDGDALRLAVACRLTVCTDGDATVSACEAHRPETGAFATQSVSECADKFAATRRAIVRAAAEMAA